MIGPTPLLAPLWRSMILRCPLGSIVLSALVRLTQFRIIVNQNTARYCSFGVLYVFNNFVDRHRPDDSVRTGLRLRRIITLLHRNFLPGRCHIKKVYAGYGSGGVLAYYRDTAIGAVSESKQPEG